MPIVVPMYVFTKLVMMACYSTKFYVRKQSFKANNLETYDMKKKLKNLSRRS